MALQKKTSIVILGSYDLKIYLYFFKKLIGKKLQWSEFCEIGVLDILLRGSKSSQRMPTCVVV